MVKNESRADGATTHRLGYTIDRKHMGMLGFPGSDTYKTSLYPSIASLFVSLLFLGSFLMNKQHKRYTQSTPSHSLMLAVLLASPASSAGVHEAARSKAQGRSHQCASQLRW